MIRIFALVILITCLPLTVKTAAVGFVTTRGVWLSDDKAFAEDKVKVYTVLLNNSYPKLSATAVFNNNGKEIGQTRVNDLLFEEARQVWIEYVIPAGQNYISVALTNIQAADQSGAVLDVSREQLTTADTMSSFVIDFDDGDSIPDADDKESTTHKRFRVSKLWLWAGAGASFFLFIIFYGLYLDKKKI